MLLIEWTASAKIDLLEILDYILLKNAIANSLEGIGVASFVDFECLTAVRADHFMHVCAFHSYWSLSRWQSISLLGIAFGHSSRTCTEMV